MRKICEDFPNYEVDDRGNVWRIKFKRLLNGHICSSGYKAVMLRRDGKNFHVRVHRLVAKAFIPNPSNKPQVNHKNGVRNDPSVENLEWVTNRENVCHSYSILHRDNGWKVSRDDAREIRRLYNNGILQRIIAEKFNCSQSNISMIVNGRSRK